jgi:uncharacterized protein YebE (UPF0316 family)
MVLASVWAGVFIFSLRIIDVSLYTLRLVMVVRGRKALAGIFAFCQSVVFVSAIRSVFTDLNNIGKVIGYAAGFATGLVVGMLIEERLAIGFTHLRIFSSGLGAEITEYLRMQGYAVTEVAARGQDGTVDLLNCSVLRKEARKVEAIVSTADPEAFIIAEDVRPVQRGLWRRESTKIID